MMMPTRCEKSKSAEIWADETRDFNMLAVRSTIRNPQEEPGKLVNSYNWYPSAVSVDAIFPPGVSLSVKEICAYYPHHIRWQDVMLRLSHNDYRGTDILGIQAYFRGLAQTHMSGPTLNQIQRDAVQRFIPGFKTTGYDGEGDEATCTDDLKPGLYLEKKLKGYTVPTFDDLLQDLTSLPLGEDARVLTQCLMWYLANCNTFTPKLELNVLHTQALVRALKQPLKPAASQNLNRLALEQWREEEMLPKFDIPAAAEGIKSETDVTRSVKHQTRSKAVFDLRSDPVDVNMTVTIPIRHVLTFPFLALQNIVAEAFQLGIGKAENRRAIRKGYAEPLKSAVGARATREDTPQQTQKRHHELPTAQNQTPKRPRLLMDIAEAGEKRTPKRPTVSPITPRSQLRNPAKLDINRWKRDSAYSRRWSDI